MIEFRVSGIPKGQPRPRAFSFNGQARVYDPGTAENWKGEIAAAARAHIPLAPLAGPLRVEIDLFFPRPKAHFTAKGKRPEAPDWHTKKPDADNAAKAILDALTVLRMWGDDTQVCSLECRKYYAEAPGANIRIKAMI